MAKKMIKHLLFSYGVEEKNPLYHKGGNQPEMIVLEGLARHGDVVDVTRDYDLERGKRLDAFYTDAEKKAIEAGTYKGIDAPALYAKRLGAAQAAVQNIEDEGVGGEGGRGQIEVDEVSSEQLAEYIKSNKLTVPEVVSLAGEDPDVDRINKILDAENMALDNEPRSGVISALEARLAAASQS
jgi:hypothetical protein